MMYGIAAGFKTAAPRGATTFGLQAGRVVEPSGWSTGIFTNLCAMLLRDQCILGIESTGFAVSVGLSAKGVARGHIFRNDGAPGSKTLLTVIDQLLSMLSVEKRALDGICVCLGPGSFTSLRVGLATAEALGLVLDIPIYGVDSLVLIAASVPFYPGRIQVIQKAYKGEFYTAVYETRQGRPNPLSPLKLVTPQDFRQGLQSGDLVLGNGLDTLFSLSFNPAEKGVCWNRDFCRTVTAIDVIDHFLDEPARAPAQIPLEPIYIRLSDAEIHYARRFKS